MSELDRRYYELRAEWLKIKGCLYDPNTGLPALPAVIEEVRRRIEDGTRLGLVSLDLRSEEGLEEVYGWETYDNLIQQAAIALRGLRGGILESDDIIALQGVRSDEFLIFARISDEGDGPDHVLHRLRDRLATEISGLMQIEVGSEGPRGVGVQAGAALLHHDPTVRVERMMYRVLDRVKSQCRNERDRHETLRLNELRRIVAERDIVVRYQPIVRLKDRKIYGFEALSSSASGSFFDNPEIFFTFAEKTDQILDLERLCRLESVRGAHRLAQGRRLFMNCSAHGLADVEFFRGPVLDQARALGLDASNLVVEITERVSAAAEHRLRANLAELRQAGFSIAIDDMGAGYSSLHSLAQVEPEFLKLDITLVRDVHENPIKQELLESMVSLAKKIGARVIAEGIEKREEYRVLKAMDVELGQGYYFSPMTSFPRHHPEGSPYRTGEDEWVDA